jgi:oligopeptide transport system substrate-binding protein
MAKKNEKLTVSRRDFLKSAGALGLVAAAGSAIPLSIFSSSCTQGQPAGSQTWTVNLAGEPPSIDPNLSSWAASRTVILRCFEGLLAFNKDLSLKADVAKEIPTVGNGGISADGMTYTFKLNTKAAWSDGKKVTAGDFVYSIKRMLDPAYAAEYASFYYDIVGAEAYNGAADKDAATQASLKADVGVKALDDATLEIKLAQPRPTFLSLMALWPVYPVREDTITANGDQWTEAGTYLGNGPWVLTEWVHQDHMTFEPNTNYWGTKPKLTKITYKMITDANAAWAAYLNGELDASGPPSGTEKTVMADPTLSPQIVRYNDLTTYAFQFQIHTAPYSNKTLRQALSCAFDRQAYIDQVRGGVGKVALSWIPPGMPGYNASLGQEYTFDVAKAKTLLTQALSELGLSDVSKLNLKFQYSNTGLTPPLAQLLQQQLKDNLGISLTIEPMESAAFSKMVNAEQETWAFFGWGADYPDPDNWLPELFGTDAGNNHTTYSNPDFDALAAKAKQELDNTKRLQEWDQAQAMVIADAPILTVFYRERFVCVKPYVKGFTPAGMDGQIAGDMFFENITIEK